MISAAKRLKEEGCEFEDNLGHIERPCPREGEGAKQKNTYKHIFMSLDLEKASPSGAGQFYLHL